MPVSSQECTPSEPGDQTPTKTSAEALTPRRSPRLAVKRKLIQSNDGCGTSSKVWRQSSPFLDSISIALQADCFEKYGYKLLYDGDKQFLEVTRKIVDIPATSGGPLAAARVIIYDDGVCYFNIVGDSDMVKQKELTAGPDLDTKLISALEILGPQWALCGGISTTEFEAATNAFRYRPACKERSVPFKAIHAQGCMTWFIPPKRRKLKLDICNRCAEFRRNLKKRIKTNLLSEEGKKKRQDPSSHFPWKFLSPTSRGIRHKKASRKRTADVQKIQRLAKRLHKYKVQLDESQNSEMADIVNIINQKYSDEVQSVIGDGSGGSPEAHQVLKDLWDSETTDREDFYRDQMNNKTGSRGNMWSTITYRIALAVYTKSPAAYESLKSFKILQLPSIRSLQEIAGSKLHEPGITEGIQEYLHQQEVKYTAYKEEMVKSGKPEPKNEGILIFDEVRVTARVKWTSKGEKFFGLEMNPEEFPYLHDIYEDLDPNRAPRPAQYMIQFMWRDLTSDFDVVGPYFSAAQSLEHGFIISCINQTMRTFHAYNFEVVGMVCDGASSNLAAIKMLCTGHRGTYGTKEPDYDGDRHEVRAHFINPFNPQLKVYCCICPSHQLKNLINALCQSRGAGTKRFCLNNDNLYFGWNSIRDLYDREMNRADAGQLRHVPKLKRSFIDRDAWTKLSVYPAKIIQQTAVLRELQSYLDTDECHNRNDNQSVTQCLQYLQACNKLFENGFLSHELIRDMQSPVLLNIQEGFSFFSNWFESLEADGRPFCPTNSLERRFLAWQTWDLLRICLYGFRAFCDDFLTRHGDMYYVTPLKWNGSAVETLFSQFKSITGGKLDSTNYATARKMFLARRDALGHRPSAAVAGYRNVPLYVAQTPLARRWIRYSHVLSNSQTKLQKYL